MKLAIMSFAHLHAEAYAQQLNAMPAVELAGIADDDLARGERFARLYGTRHYLGYEALLEDGPDGVVICSENARHRALVELAANAGVHVLCEKPLATSLADGQAMLDACRRAGVILMTAFPMRFSAPALALKRAVAGGGLGRVLACNTTNQGQLPARYRDWFVDKELAGGGSVMDHTVHLADLLRWILQSEVTEVYAQVNRIMHADTVEVETGGLLLVTFGNGAFASIDCSWSRPSNYPTWGGLTMDVIGERGVINMDAFAQNLVRYSNRDEHPSWLPWMSDPDGAMIAEFVAAIREGRHPSVTGHDGYRALEVALAAYRSAEEGQPVQLPLV